MVLKITYNGKTYESHLKQLDGNFELEGWLSFDRFTQNLSYNISGNDFSRTGVHICETPSEAVCPSDKCGDPKTRSGFCIEKAGQLKIELKEGQVYLQNKSLEECIQKSD